MTGAMRRTMGIAALMVAAPVSADAQAGPLAVTGIDHVGINVPDADRAIAFFAQLFAAHVLTDMRPAPVSPAWKRRFHWHASSRLKRMVMLQEPDGSKIELFEYAGPLMSRTRPYEDDAAETHIAFKAHDPEATLAVVRRLGLPVLNAPATGPDGSRWVYMLTPWGSQIELVFAPDE